MKKNKQYISHELKDRKITMKYYQSHHCVHGNCRDELDHYPVYDHEQNNLQYNASPKNKSIITMVSMIMIIMST